VVSAAKSESQFLSPVKWCLDNSISSQITTPVSAQDLSSALISALESNTVSPVSAPNDVVFDILLAEDNLVNQKLAVKILEKYGHTVEIAENGSLAVDAFKSRVTQNKPFDIILVRTYCLIPSLSPLMNGRRRWMYRCRLWVAWKRPN
jgi:PleD family two-component response regulator